MELIKRKIYLENDVDRTFNSKSWGKLTADTFYINVYLTQNIDDMGLFTDIEYIDSNVVTTKPDYSLLSNKLASSGITFPFMIGVIPNTQQVTNPTEILTLRTPIKTESSFYNYGNNSLTAITESKIDEVISYDNNDRYKVGLDMAKGPYVNYNNIIINAVSRVTSNSEPKTYVLDTENNSLLGTDSQTTGLFYKDFIDLTTTVRYTTEGINRTNVSLSAITKEEYLFGIISQPEVKSDVFIDRTITSVNDLHLRLAEIKNLDSLVRYGNGFYNITKI
jgi:hypothetical protein